MDQTEREAILARQDRVVRDIADSIGFQATPAVIEAIRDAYITGWQDCQRRYAGTD